MSNIVISQVVRMNNFEYPNGRSRGIDCNLASMEGFFWRVPYGGGGCSGGAGSIYFKYVAAVTGAPKPTPDSLRVLRVRDAQNRVYMVAVTDTAPDTTFTDICGLCCGGSYVMPAAPIPDPVFEETGCADDTGNYVYFSITAPLAAGDKYYLNASQNGAAFSPAPPADGFDTLAALATWANANWGPASVAVAGNKVTLTTAAGTTGSISVSQRKYFDSNVPGALAAGQHYHLAATVNGIALTPIDGAANAALSTVASAANANAAYAAYGTWSVDAAGGIRLLSDTASSATVAVTKV